MAQHSHSPKDEGALARETLAHSHAHVTDTTEPGTMDITQQQHTFVSFIRFATRMAGLIVVLLLLLALFNG